MGSSGGAACSLGSYHSSAPDHQHFCSRLDPSCPPSSFICNGFELFPSPHSAPVPRSGRPRSSPEAPVWGPCTNAGTPTVAVIQNRCSANCELNHREPPLESHWCGVRSHSKRSEICSSLSVLQALCPASSDKLPH
uniref:Uncharacterized protein n=1 Tax=Knipowitschia caucasica TaxID=637954 RepID=A0AAV2JLP5_KNICA